MKKYYFYTLSIIFILNLNCDNGFFSPSTNEYSTGIAFMYFDPEISETKLEIMDEKGNNKSTILVGEISIHDFKWSKDGKKLIYSISSEDSSAIYFYDFRLKIKKLLYSNINEVSQHLDISYDHSKLAFSIRNKETNTGSIAVMNIISKDCIKIVDGFASNLKYSIDDRIYFIKDKNIYSINDDGSDILQVTPDSENGIFSYDVSPSGENIIYSRFNEADFLLQYDKIGNQHQILFSIDSIAVNGLDYIAEPKFTPDGSMIYFGHKSKLISFYNLQTKKMRHVYYGDSNIYHIWLIPGTEKIVYTTNKDWMFNILTIGIDGESKTELFKTSSGYWDLKISPVKIAF